MIFVGQPMPYEIGPATVAVPGVPAGAHHLWQHWGRLPWADVVGPGLQASYGTPFPEAHASLLPAVAAAMVVGDGVLATNVRTARCSRPAIPWFTMITIGRTNC